MDKVVVELTPEEAQLFILFRQHQQVFKTMAENNAFGVNRGNVILSFNEGRLDAIKFELLQYKHGLNT